MATIFHNGWGGTYRIDTQIDTQLEGEMAHVISPETRIRDWIKRYKETEFNVTGHIPDPDDVIRALIDEDVSAGEYEGCSSELELAYAEYQGAMERVIEEGK